MSSEGAGADASADASLEALTSDLQQLAVSNPQESVFQDADLLERLLEALHPAEPRDASLLTITAEGTSLLTGWKEAVRDIALARCVCLAWRNAGARPLVVAALQKRLFGLDMFCGVLSGMRADKHVPNATAEEIYGKMSLSQADRGAAEWIRAGWENSVNSIICDPQRAYRSSVSASVRFFLKMGVRRLLLIVDESTLEAWEQVLGAELEPASVRRNAPAIDGFFRALIDGFEDQIIYICTWTALQRRLRQRRLSMLGVQLVQGLRADLGVDEAEAHELVQLSVMEILLDADDIFQMSWSLILCDFAASWAFQEKEAAAPATPQEAALAMASGAREFYRAKGCDYIIAAGAARPVYFREEDPGPRPTSNWVMLTDRLPEDAVGLSKCLEMMTCKGKYGFGRAAALHHFGDESMRRWSTSLVESSGKEALNQFVWNSDEVRRQVPTRTISSALRMWRDGWGR